MDDESRSRMKELNLESVIVLSYLELEEHDKQLSDIKNSRSLVEYYFTCTPAICNYIIELYPEIELITYLDSDLYFFSSPESVYTEIGGKSIAIVEHRFSKYGRKFIKLGRFNVAWISFRRDDQGIRCLKEYREQCLDWCYDYLDGDKYADQKYLDKWPEKYYNLIVIQNKGVNLACWNLGNYTIRKKGGQILVDDDPLIFYHFAGLKQLNSGNYTTSISSYFVRPGGVVKNDIYSVYIIKLKSFSRGSDITKKTVNPKRMKFSFGKSAKNMIRNIRIFSFGDIIKV